MYDHVAKNAGRLVSSRANLRVASFIEKQGVTEKVLKHLLAWEAKPQLPPRMAKTQPLHTEAHIDYSDSQKPPSDYGLYADPVSPEDLPA